MTLRRRIGLGLKWASIALFTVVVLHRFVPVRAAAPSTGNARSFTLTALDGSPIPPSAYRGKALVLNYWAPWCPPCRFEIPWLQKLQDKDRGKLVVVGVVADPSEYAHAATMMKGKGVTYLLARDSSSLIAAFGDPDALPTTFYISPSSHVVHSVTGVIPEYAMSRYAADAMEQK
ncbi:MAG: TlpA disulfide reductase family protein [Acidobacteriota bacterium]